MAEIEDKNTDDFDFDIDAGVEAVSLDLFGGAGKGEAAPALETADDEAESAVELPEGESEAAAETVAENTPAAPNDEPPKTWTKEAIAEWATIPPKVKAEIHKREQDFFKGIEQYKESAAIGKAYDSVVEPYRAALAAENINPVELFKAFAANHYTLARGTKEQKISIVKNLMQGYGIDPDEVADQFSPAPYIDPALKSVQDELAELKREREMLAAREANSAREAIGRQITEFASDPANPHFDKVSHLIPSLLQSGIAKDLADAYQQAVMLNPETRELELTRRQTEAAEKIAQANAAKLQAAKAASAVNVRTSMKSAGGTTPVGSIDDTLNETMARLRAAS
jgi:hypothetical protein